MIFDHPCAAITADTPPYSGIPRCPGRPRGSPLIGAFGLQPGGRLVDQADDGIHVIHLGGADGKVVVHGSVVLTVPAWCPSQYRAQGALAGSRWATAWPSTWCMLTGRGHA